MLQKKPFLIDMSEYKLTTAGKFGKIFDKIPQTIKRTGFNIFDYDKVFTDEETNKLIRTGRTIGCFYIESPGMRSLLRKLDCHSFEMLTAASSVIRPGVAESGMMKEFIERHKDPSKRKYLIPEMEKYLGETYGVMIYQEDVIKIAYHLVGLTLEEADLLRRAMSGKMRSHKAMQLIVDKFFRCCREKGYSDAIANKLWTQIESFAGYAFCKAHSASFAVLSYQVAYLKAHYPAEFMAGVLNNGGGYYSSAVYIGESKRLGIKILLPCVNKSEYNYIGIGNEIRIGFIAIKNFNKKSADIIIEDRKRRGDFFSLSEFLSRTHLTFEQTELLIKCGAMDIFKQTRPTLLRLLDLYFYNRDFLEGDNFNLFAGTTTHLEKDLITTTNFTIEEACTHEFEIFGYMVSAHPLNFFAETNHPSIIKAADIEKYHNKRVKMTGWYMAAKRVVTSKGKVMKFLSLEDLTGTFEAVIFPDAYEKYAELTVSMGPYLIEGIVDAEEGNNIIVKKLSVLSAAKAASITQKDRTNKDFFGESEKPLEYDEISLVSSLGKEKLRLAYL
ncbi:MAG: hypothetical protein CMF23_03770 [Ignavibacteriae bacterium]|nr:hypothetical protein [Ignavibacteriota bacterium]